YLPRRFTKPGRVHPAGAQPPRLVPPLDGRDAVVTGASRGIGAAIAAALRTAGASVVRAVRSLADRREDGYHDLRCDVSDAAGVDGFARRVRGEYGVPEVVVSNA